MRSGFKRILLAPSPSQSCALGPCLPHKRGGDECLGLFVAVVRHFLFVSRLQPLQKFFGSFFQKRTLSSSPKPPRSTSPSRKNNCSSTRFTLNLKSSVSRTRASTSSMRIRVKLATSPSRRAGVNRRLGHRFQRGLDISVIAVLAADHEGQRARVRRHDPARDRRVGEPEPRRARRRTDRTGAVHIDGGRQSIRSDPFGALGITSFK